MIDCGASLRYTLQTSIYSAAGRSMCARETTCAGVTTARGHSSKDAMLDILQHRSSSAITSLLQVSGPNHPTVRNRL